LLDGVYFRFNVNRHHKSHCPWAFTSTHRNNECSWNEWAADKLPTVMPEQKWPNLQNPGIWSW
jgi:hypothetical protein